MILVLFLVLVLILILVLVAFPLGREDEAIECFDEAIRLNFEDAEYFYYESISLANLKRDGEAQEARNQALKLNPNIVAEEEGNEKAEKGRDNPEASEGRLSDKNIIKNELGNNQPGRAFESWSKNTNMKYPAIADLIGIFKWAATTCLFLMVLTGMVVIAMAFSAGQYTGTGGFVAILAFGLGIELLLGLGWLLTKAFSELFQVFIDIEENTRKKE